MDERTKNLIQSALFGLVQAKHIIDAAMDDLTRASAVQLNESVDMALPLHQALVSPSASEQMPYL